MSTHHSSTDQQQLQTEIEAHSNRLYAALKQARQELRNLRLQAGLHAHAAGPHIDRKGHHANDSIEQRHREKNESANHEDGGGEHGHKEGSEHGYREGRARGDRHTEGHEHRTSGRREHGHEKGSEHGHREGRERVGREHSSKGIAKLTKHVKTYKNGGRLTLQYNAATQAFVGTVKNTSKKVLPDMRVEIHLSNGVELGPTERTEVKPGETIPVELGAFGQEFTHWTTHPEVGIEEAHGPGDEENEHSGGEPSGHAAREPGEHSGGHSHDGSGEGGHGMGDATLRPIYNQLQLLRGELKAFAADIAKGNTLK